MLGILLIISIIVLMVIFMLWLFSPNETTRALLILTGIATFFLLIGNTLIPQTAHQQTVAESSQVSSEDDTEDLLESEAEKDPEEETSEVESSSSSLSSAEETSTSESVQSSVVTETSSSVTSVESSTSEVTDTRPANDERSNYSYAYQPPHAVTSEQIVYVNPTISGRYHLDPNCRGLTRHGGGTAMSLEEAKAQGYVAECTYERYGGH